MKLSKKCEYALKTMTYLSFAYKKRLVQIKEIAETERIPLKFLEQILILLKKAGYLESKRGANGGYFLIKAPESVSLAEIIRIIDGPLAPVNCVSKWAYVDCEQRDSCRLFFVMLKVRNAVAGILEKTSFADLCAEELPGAEEK